MPTAVVASIRIGLLFSFIPSNSNYSNKMPIDLHHVPGSAPCRAVRLAAKLVGVDLNLIYTDLTKGEHMTPEYLKANPQHTVPTINDNGFHLHESRAIITYFANKYGKDDSLYPKEPEKRAIVDELLYFDIGTLYQRFGDYWYPVMFAGASFDEEKKKKLDEALGFLDKFLEGKTFAAGDSITVADASLAASVSTIEIAGIDFSAHKNVVAWFAASKAALPGYEEENHKGAVAFRELFDNITGGKYKQ